MPRSNKLYTVLCFFQMLLVFILLSGCGGDSDSGVNPGSDTTAPGEVNGFMGIHGDSFVSLTWTNPGDSDFAGVVVRRDSLAAPSGPEAGSLVYNGAGTNCIASGLVNDIAYYFAAFAYDGNGNHSSGVQLSVTPHAPIVVTFADQGLENAVRAEIGLPAGDIHDDELATITTLAAVDSGIVDLGGLEYCVNLTALDLSSNEISDAGNTGAISQLTHLVDLNLYENNIGIIPNMSGLTNLENLDLSANNISNLSPLSDLASLRSLTLYSNNISDIEDLSGLTNLQTLHISWNSISDVGPLAGLLALETLYMRSNSVSDIGPLAGLVALYFLDISDNSISDISSIAELASLQYLSAYGNGISDISPLAGNTELQSLSLDSNAISEVGALAGLTGLEHLSLTENGLSDISPLASLTDMVSLHLSANDINDISALASMTAVEGLFLEVNSISDISILAGLFNLQQLGLASNLIEDVSALVDNTGLDSGDMVNLLDNPLSADALNIQIPALQARGVWVEY